MKLIQNKIEKSDEVRQKKFDEILEIESKLIELSHTISYLQENIANTSAQMKQLDLNDRVRLVKSLLGENEILINQCNEYEKQDLNSETLSLRNKICENEKLIEKITNKDVALYLNLYKSLTKEKKQLKLLENNEKITKIKYENAKKELKSIEMSINGLNDKKDKLELALEK